MFFEVLRLTYHSPITIELITYRVLLGTLGYSSWCASLIAPTSYLQHLPDLSRSFVGAGPMAGARTGRAKNDFARLNGLLNRCLLSTRQTRRPGSNTDSVHLLQQRRSLDGHCCGRACWRAG